MQYIEKLIFVKLQKNTLLKFIRMTLYIHIDQSMHLQLKKYILDVSIRFITEIILKLQ